MLKKRREVGVMVGLVAVKSVGLSSSFNVLKRKGGLV